MVNINSALIQELRKRTSVSLIKCKQALIETNGNIELAIENLRKSGLETALKKSGRATPAGLIAVHIASNKQYGIMVEINCETDFVVKDSIFQEFTKLVIATALNEAINNIDKLKARFKNQCADLISKVGENINIRRFVTLTGDCLISYVHGTKIGVIVVANNSNVPIELLKHVAMHIAAKNPKYININDIPESVIMRERRIQMDIAIRSGKSHKIAEKIVLGRMNKFINEIVLTKQSFVMDTNKIVGDLLNEHCITINNFVRFELGDDT